MQNADVGPRPSSIDHATWSTRAMFDSAVRTADTARIAALFAPNAYLIDRHGDTVHGNEAIARYAAALGQGSTPTVSWGREGSLESCIGAAREQLVFTAHLNHPDGTSSTTSGSLSVFWMQDSTGAVKVAWIALPNAEKGRPLTRSECRTVEDLVSRTWRWAVSVYPAPAFATGQLQPSFESVLRARGWVDRDCVCAKIFPTYTPISDWTFVVPPSLVTVQYHARRHVVAELAVGRAPQGNTMGAQYFPNRDYGHIHLWSSTHFVAALVSYERWGLQLGAGPVLQFTQWRLRDSLVSFSTGTGASFTDHAWSRSSVGIVGDLRYHRVLNQRTFLAIRTQMRWLPQSRTVATPRFPSATLDQGSKLFGVGFGLIL